ncbi:MAG: hypothetical protein ABEJ59_00910 [Halanaeroarchaeum sp.]
MSTAVRMSETAKNRLEKLQARIRLETGRKVTQQAILERLVNDAYETSEEFVASFRETAVPLSPDDIERLQRGRIDSGTETTEANIDEILYG